MEMLIKKWEKISVILVLNRNRESLKEYTTGNDTGKDLQLKVDPEIPVDLLAHQVPVGRN